MAENERLKILEMLEQGKITASEASELLDALGSGDDSEEFITAAPAEVTAAPPNMDRFRHFSQLPLAAASGLLALVGAGLVLTYEYAQGPATLGLLCLWTLFIIAALATGLAALAMRAPWLHLRVKEKAGKRIAISLPIPFPLVRIGMQIARGHVDQETLAHLDTAEVFLSEYDRSRGGARSELLVIDVDDEDGDSVQIFIG